MTLDPRDNPAGSYRKRALDLLAGEHATPEEVLSTSADAIAFALLAIEAQLAQIAANTDGLNPRE